MYFMIMISMYVYQIYKNNIFSLKLENKLKSSKVNTVFIFPFFSRGFGKGEDAAFRPDFSKVGELRALIQAVPVLA